MITEFNSLTGSEFVDGVCVKEPDSIYNVVDDKGVTSQVVVPCGTKEVDVEAVVVEKLSVQLGMK